MLFYSSSWNLLDGCGLSHTAVENIPVRSQKVSDPASPSVRMDIALLPVKTLETEPLYDSTMKDFVWMCFCYFLGKSGALCREAPER